MINVGTGPHFSILPDVSLIVDLMRGSMMVSGWLSQPPRNTTGGGFRTGSYPSG
ncbi:hypothetical protein PISMIDRAFT_674172 [Pisolithus microcarpus 441]|uniref:Unplaced genomic scaffold scaffold_10, whole genome shotgun sequence n=1 Tax=Pisolithus microcarpus 441 TaxID=765257 RepID=A0A0C9ZP96_9AGAM|nr:hypothetical protein PISMIDRAFT_674172 [Pisolithus microcarpus 441]